MGLENARDSFVDLLQIKAEKQVQDSTGGGASGAAGSAGASRTSFRVKKGTRSHAAFASASSSAPPEDGGFESIASTQDNDALCYEPCEVEEGEEEHWPVWEMTGDDPWSDAPTQPQQRDNSGGIMNNRGDSIGTFSEGSYSIADCERIFTVPEVYEEMMRRRRNTRMSSMTMRNQLPLHHEDQEECCGNILSCFAPWKKQQPQQTTASGNQSNAIRDLHPSHNTFDAFLESMDPDNEQNNEQHQVAIPLGVDEVLNPKGVLRRSSMAVQLYLGMPMSVRLSFTPSMFKVRLEDECDENSVVDESNGGGAGAGGAEQGGTRNRRRVSIIGNNNQHYALGGNHMNTSNEDNIKKVNKRRYKVHFGELKQVLRVRKFTPQEAIGVWFQREDFDYFKNEMTLLIQEDGASREVAEVWLEAHDPRVSTCSEEGGTSEEENEGGDGNVNGRLTRNQSCDSSSKSWWHNYDHSRRGLERYASPGQARQILASYKVALHKVLAEQQRQRLLSCLFIPGARDPEKIAEVYHEYTAWSRDLALAAGASDADAVRTNFDDDKRHTREYYMLKQVVASGYKVHKFMPQFMLPKCITPRGFLDEAESLYYDDSNTIQHAGRAGSRRGSKTSIVGSMVRSAAAGVIAPKDNLSGEEARNEMSRIDSVDLDGPVSPALAPSLEAKGKKSGTSSKKVNGSSSSSSRMQGHEKGEPIKKMSMAEKAKNYPFQQ